MIERLSRFTRSRSPLAIGIMLMALALALIGSGLLPTSSTAPTTAQVALAQTETTAAACTPGAMTPSQTEGPYYKSGTPERTSLLESGMAGTPITITGYVMSPDCQPVAGAWLDFWQADGNGAYDNRGYTLRGHQYTDADGRFVLQTVVPGEYPGRTGHIHVKVQAPGARTLTTQLYFPDMARNARDSIFNSALLLTVEDTADGQAATFTFVVPTA